jgi:hypothetical protein
LNELAEKSLGLSLSDQYWIRPSEDIRWKDVNFFTNDFSEDIGNLLITGKWDGGSFDSPDNTSDGVLRKRWKIIEGGRCLLKGSYSTVGIPQAQPFREVFASRIAKLLFDEGCVVDYWLIENDYFYSACKNFINEDTEYVSFNQINHAYKKPNHQSSFSFIQDFYGESKEQLDLLIILDYIVLNEDRHYGNFGLIRDTNTGKFIKPAPVFDTGSCLLYDSDRFELQRLQSKPFSKKFSQQIQYVETQRYGDRIQKVRENIDKIFWDSFDKSPEEENRLKRLLEICKRQIENLLS